MMDATGGAANALPRLELAIHGSRWRRLCAEVGCARLQSHLVTGLDTTNMCTATADPDRPLPDRPGWPTFQQKKKLYDLCMRLTLAELNQMVSLVQRGCQAAVQQCGDKEVEVDVDELDMDTFQNVLKWANSKTKSAQQPKSEAGAS